MRGYELALERLLRERDRLPAEEQPPEMLLLIDSLQAAGKAAAELEEAAAMLREHPLPAHPPLESLSSGERLSLHKALDTSPAAPALFKGLVHTLEAAAKSLGATRSSSVSVALFEEHFENSTLLEPVTWTAQDGRCFTHHSSETGTPISALQLLVTAATSFWVELTPRSAAASQAAHAAALLWPQDLSQEQSALEAQHWVPSFPAATAAASAAAAAAAGTAGGGVRAAAAHQVEQPCQPLAVTMAAWLVEHCPEVTLTDLQQWALKLRTCTLSILPPDKRPERLVTQLLCECQRVLNAIPPAAASAGHSRSLLAASGAGNLAKWLSKPASAGREKLLAELLEQMQDRAISSKCWLLAADAAAEQADALIRGQLRLHSRRQLQSLPALTHRTGELLVQARQLLGRAKPWLPVFMWRELLSRLRSREDGQRYLATKTGKRREWQGERPQLLPKRCVACSEAALHLRKCAQCQAVAYCSRECQVRHWKEGGHKAECAALAAQRSAQQGQ